MVDSGLAATLAGLTPGDWIERRARMGHLLEAFVVRQLTTLAGWTDPDIRFWHYRDRDGRDVDLVMTQGAPREDCAFLLGRLCEWLEGDAWLTDRLWGERRPSSRP